MFSLRASPCTTAGSRPSVRCAPSSVLGRTRNRSGRWRRPSLLFAAVLPLILLGVVAPAARAAVGDITEFPVPHAPRFITAGPDANLWYTAMNGTTIGRISTAGVVTEFPIPTPSALAQIITKGPDGNVWFTESSGNMIGRVTPSGTVTEFAIPTANSSPGGIATGPDGNLWFTETAAARRSGGSPLRGRSRSSRAA